MDIEYDGTCFQGLGRSTGAADLAGGAEAAFATVLREQVALTVAGRTDTGVDALGQVAGFMTKLRFRGALRAASTA